MLKQRSNISEELRKYQVYILLAVVYVAMALFAPRFLSADNQIALLKKASIHIVPAVGFAMVLIVGQLDLSFASAMTLGGMLTMGFQPRFGWGVAVLIGVASGIAIGYANGLLVAKAKVSSFIVTLSTLTIVQGLVLVYCRGNTLNVDDYSVLQWFDTRSFVSPPIIIAASIALLFELALLRTTYGRNLLLTGGNKQTAWHTGLSTDRLVVSAFIISGLLAGLGGAICSMKNVSATPQMGNESLMIVIAAVIVGGTSMQGGKGTVLGSVVAVLMLCAISNGLSLMKMAQESMLIVNGAVLAILVLIEAYTANRRAILKGQRPELLAQLHNCLDRVRVEERE